MIGFGQDDCGKRPKSQPSFNNPNFELSSAYLEYSKKNRLFVKCMYETLLNASKEPLPLDKNTSLITFEGVIKKN